jgi:hypothetical protein
MSLAQRLRRVEEAHQERVFRKEAERLAERYGVSVDDAYRDLHETTERVQRWGLDEALRQLADELGVTEEEMRAEYEETRREIEEEEREC